MIGISWPRRSVRRRAALMASSLTWSLMASCGLLIGFASCAGADEPPAEDLEETAAQNLIERAPPTGPKLSLEECIALGMQYQPALAAARASLNAAYSAERGISGLPRFASLVSRDVPIRREQACLGITVASAALEQAEWETRYAVRRTFYSIQYARMQKVVTDRALEKINDAYKRAEILIKEGDPEFKVTQIDLKILNVNKEFVRTKQAEATVGVKKAVAALREAIGVGPDYALDVVEEPLPPLVKELNQQALIDIALSQRAELTQAATLNQVVELEIEAQRRIRCSFQAKTFAAASDIHAKPIPQGTANGDYRPGAIGPEMPVFLVGRRGDRVQRAADFNDRAVAVVNKTENLIALEVEATLLKWLEAAQNVYNLAKTPELAREVGADIQKRFNDGKATGEEYLRGRTLEDQAQALYNDALYQHALALAALERVTAGGYRIGH